MANWQQRSEITNDNRDQTWPQTSNMTMEIKHGNVSSNMAMEIRNGKGDQIW